MNEEYKKKISNLILAKQGIEAEYQYVHQKDVEKFEKEEQLINKLKREKNELNIAKDYYKDEFEKLVGKLEYTNAELEQIKNSRWWKIREKLKGNK